MLRPALLSVLLTGCALAPLGAVVTPAPIFGDTMVIQRDAPVCVFGSADAGESVKVTFDGESVSVKADGKGQWLAKLKPRKASGTGRVLTVAGPGNTVEIRDVLVGDVWVSAGQSNMEWRLGQDAEGRAAVAKADPLLRIATFEKPGSDVGSKALGGDANRRLHPEYYYAGAWGVSGGKVSAASSAVAYWFGAKLRAEADVPVGLVGFAIGGAPLESFVSRDALKKGGFGKKLAGDWTKNKALPSWCSTRAGQNLAKVKDAPGDALGKNHGYKPGFAWESGMGRMTDFPVAGFLWYQGESNAIDDVCIKEYAELQKVMVADWRAKWANPKLPFYFVQLSSCESGDRKHWGEFRNNQRLGLDLIPAPAGMAVSYDFGPAANAKSNVHPTQKKPIGERLARWALRDVYGQKSLEVSGPSPLKVLAKGAELAVTFTHAKGLKAAGDSPLSGFQLAGSDGKFVPATAKIVGESVVVSAKEITSPKTVRYAWDSYCMDANLVNGDNLPASTFQVGL